MAKKDKLTAEEKEVVAEEAAAQVAFEAEESERADSDNTGRIAAAEQVDVLPAPAEPPADETGRLRNAISLAITALEGSSSREAIEQALRILRSA